MVTAGVYTVALSGGLQNGRSPWMCGVGGTVHGRAGRFSAWCRTTSEVFAVFDVLQLGYMSWVSARALSRRHLPLGDPRFRQGAAVSGAGSVDSRPGRRAGPPRMAGCARDSGLFWTILCAAWQSTACPRFPAFTARMQSCGRVPSRSLDVLGRRKPRRHDAFYVFRRFLAFSAQPERLASHESPPVITVPLTIWLPCRGWGFIDVPGFLDPMFRVAKSPTSSCWGRLVVVGLDGIALAWLLYRAAACARDPWPGDPLGLPIALR